MSETETYTARLILDIEQSDFSQIGTRPADETFELRPVPALMSNLSGGVGTYLVRAILDELGVDQHRIFRWRLENKYIQYLIFNHYVPDSMAVTFSFANLMLEHDSVQKINQLCANGFFIKSTLGDSSGRKKSFDRTEELDEIIHSHRALYKDEQEKWIIQQKLDLQDEFRIHTFGKDLIDGLTFVIAGGNSSNGWAAQRLVRTVLEKLPDSILQGTLIGWDIGVTTSDKLYIIEANFTGFHPEYGEGFQTSGYFGDSRYGSIVCAWFNNYFKKKYKISIGSVEDSLLTYEFFREFVFYASVFKVEHLDLYAHRSEGKYLAVVIYVDNYTTGLFTNLVKYFRLINFADQFYLITDKEYLPALMNTFSKNDPVNFLIENNFFDQDKYHVIKQLTYSARKQIFCHHVIGLIEEKSYVII